MSELSPLIVDFPRERNRLVHFSTVSDLWVYERDDGKDISKNWYSKSEYVRMKLELRCSILNKYATNQGNSSGGRVFGLLLDNYRQEDESDEVGLVDPNVVRWVHAHKMIHMRAVLEEQERQDHSGESNPFKIASVSQLFSQWSSIRAQRPNRKGSIDVVAPDVTNDVTNVPQTQF